MIAIIKTPAQRIRSARLARKLTQDQLGRLAGMVQAMVSRVESGAVVDHDIIVRLEEALGTDLSFNPVAETPERASSLAQDMGIGRVYWTPQKPTIPLEARISQACLTFGADWMRRLQTKLKSLPDAALNISILASLFLDSSYELVYIMLLLAEGWVFRRATPLSLDCRYWIRDRFTGQYIGDVPRWVLYHPDPACKIALIPQVSTLSHRLDFPGVAAVGPNRAGLLIEVDGQHHATEAQHQRDLQRTLDVNLPTLRITVALLQSEQPLTREIVAFARPLCTGRAKMTRHWA